MTRIKRIAAFALAISIAGFLASESWAQATGGGQGGSSAGRPSSPGTNTPSQSAVPSPTPQVSGNQADQIGGSGDVDISVDAQRGDADVNVQRRAGSQTRSGGRTGVGIDDRSGFGARQQTIDRRRQQRMGDRQRRQPRTDRQFQDGIDREQGLDRTGQDGRQNGQMQGNFDLDFEAGADGDLTISSLGRIGANAGLREGDRILSINGRTFQTRDDAMVYLRRFNRGRVPIDVWRDGRRVTYFLSFGPWVNDPWGRSFRYYDQPYYTYNDDVYFDRRDVVARASLGVNVIAAERGGVVVDSIFRDSPAFLAGIRAGDIIVSVNGRRFGGPTLFVNGIRQMSPGEDIDIVVLRDGQEMTFNTQLADGRAAFAQGLMERGEFDEIASRTDSQSRTTLRPNFDGQSRIQIQQRIDELNEELRSLQDRLGRAGEDAQTQGSPTTGAEQRPDTPITGDQQTPDTGTGHPSRQTPEGDTAELPPPPPGGENPAGPGQQSSTNPSAPPSSPTPNPGG